MMIVKGDVVLNGTVTIEDFVLAKLYAKGLTTLSDNAIIAGDIDGDGTLSHSDANSIWAHINGTQMITQVVQG